MAFYINRTKAIIIGYVAEYVYAYIHFFFWREINFQLKGNAQFKRTSDRQLDKLGFLVNF